MKFPRFNTTLISGILLFLLFAGAFLLMRYSVNISIVLGIIGGASGGLIVAWSHTEERELPLLEKPDKEDSSSASEDLSAQNNSNPEAEESESASESLSASNNSNPADASSSGESNSGETVVYSPITYLADEYPGETNAEEQLKEPEEQENPTVSQTSSEKANADSKTLEKNDKTTTRHRQGHSLLSWLFMREKQSPQSHAQGLSWLLLGLKRSPKSGSTTPKNIKDKQNTEDTEDISN